MRIVVYLFAAFWFVLAAVLTGATLVAVMEGRRILPMLPVAAVVAFLVGARSFLAARRARGRRRVSARQQN